jgi:GDSL-like Lipase/Acylhydrolase family
MTVLVPRSVVAAIAVVVLASCAAIWAQQLAAPSQAVWTPTADAPRGLLTQLEGDRHDRFIRRAQAGDIDIVFFGTTATEMWMWPDRGRSVWDRTFGSLKGADFGSQGTRFESLVWRMRNGELDGYRAKLVVLQAQGDDDTIVRDGNFDDYAAKYAAIIAEIRARQPQARILLFGVFPRSRTHNGLQANAALSKLANNETVFFSDISDRFFRPDGSYKSEMWSGTPNVGMHEPAFELWAEALQLWLDRFVR